MRRRLIFAAVLALQGCDLDDAARAADPPAAPLDLSAYEPVFVEDFDALDVSGFDCDTRWIAHTPYKGDFGDAKFADPSRRFPFRIIDGELRIEARKWYGQWESGLLSSQNECGTGYVQQYGYFEARMKLPAGDGVWPAFWMLSDDFDGYRAELDVVEFYGHEPGKFQSSYILHNIENDHRAYSDNHWRKIAPGSLSSDYHLYGVSIEEDYIDFYFDRQAYWRIRTPEEFKRPFYLLVNLALGSGFSIENTPDPSYMFVDYIRAYRKSPAAGDSDPAADE